MDRWISAHRALDGALAPLTMGYLTRDDLPFYYALADAYHGLRQLSRLGARPDPSQPLLPDDRDRRSGRQGRAARSSTTRRGISTGRPIPSGSSAPAFPGASITISTIIYCNVLRFFAQYKAASPTSSLFRNARLDRPFYELLWDIRHGNIPQVTWIVPPSYLSEHPDYLPAAGEDHTRKDP